MLDYLMGKIEEGHTNLETDGAVSRSEMDTYRAHVELTPEIRADVETFVMHNTPERHKFKNAKGQQCVVYFDERGRAADSPISSISGGELMRIAEGHGWVKPASPAEVDGVGEGAPLARAGEALVVSIPAIGAIRESIGAGVLDEEEDELEAREAKLDALKKVKPGATVLVRSKKHKVKTNAGPYGPHNRVEIVLLGGKGVEYVLFLPKSARYMASYFNIGGRGMPKTRNISVDDISMSGMKESISTYEAHGSLSEARRKDPRDRRTFLSGYIQKDLSGLVDGMHFGTDSLRMEPNLRKEWKKFEAKAHGDLDAMEKHIDAIEAIARKYD